MILNKGAWVDRDLLHKGPPLSLHPTPFHRLKLRLILKRKQTDTHTPIDISNHFIINLEKVFYLLMRSFSWGGGWGWVVVVQNSKWQGGEVLTTHCILSSY